MNPLVIIPTYNERENVGPLADQLCALPVALDILFVDDNSPDGTGRLLDEIAARHPAVRVMHRPQKEGIGAAHLAALARARQEGYDVVLTMDCDFTHCPTDIPRFLAEQADVVVGSRYLSKDSLKGWNWKRKFLTRLAHTLTQFLLGLPYDSTGAFRLYRLDRLPPEIFSLVGSKSYPFFFESLYLLHLNGVSIKEVPITLPPRTYGSSKMPITEPFRGIVHLLSVRLRRSRRPEACLCPTQTVAADPEVRDEQGWDGYWETAKGGSWAYSFIASVYRRLVITRQFTKALRKTFALGSNLLHAGCGSGQVDVAIQNDFRLTAVDASLAALRVYARTVRRAAHIRHASIFRLPFPDQSFDGVYNLGVMEHFTPAEIGQILAEFHRVLKPGGRILIFWPHARATSVAVLKVWHILRGSLLGSTEKLHPAEVSLLASRSWVENLLQKSNFQLCSYQFDGRDFWVQAVIVAAPEPAPR